MFEQLWQCMQKQYMLYNPIGAMAEEGRTQVHVSIKDALDTLDVYKSDVSNLFHCPLCPKEKVQFDTPAKAVGHLQSHLSWVVIHKSLKIYKCHQSCRDKPHYHCCFCPHTIMRRKDLIEHLSRHEMVNPAQKVTEQLREHPQEKPREYLKERLPHMQIFGTAKQKREVVPCPDCHLVVNSKNLKRHILRKHKTVVMDITAENHLSSQCIDPVNGIYAVAKRFHGPPVPIHVKQKLQGQSECEEDDCNLLYNVAFRSAQQAFRCLHLRSLDYCSDPPSICMLNEETLNDMVEHKWFEESEKQSCLERLKEATVETAPLAVAVKIGPPKKRYVSVFEKRVSHYCRLGRVMVMYDTQKDSWHCHCVTAGISCPHKDIAKWFLFQVERQLFMTANSSKPAEVLKPEEFVAQTRDTIKMEKLKRTIKYVFDKKKYPANLPESVIRPSFVPLPPKHLVPSEIFCSECTSHVPLSDPILITSKAKIVSLTAVYEDVSTYYKTCLSCGMDYRYQEWEQGIHNFDNYILMGLHFCLYLRASLQTHNAAGRVFEAMELVSGVKLPPHNHLLHAYLQFEALTKHEYEYSCINCGFHPPVVIIGHHKKGFFSLPVDEVSEPDGYNGIVDMQDFWEFISLDIISHGFSNVKEENLFVFQPKFSRWAPWIGPKTRKAHLVLNTEWDKIHSSMPMAEKEAADISEDRLLDEIMKMKVSDVRKLCKSCGVEATGLKMDMILRLQKEIKSRASYDKICEKVSCASGGWAAILCPCGIVYSLKFNMSAGSLGDYMDLLLSWLHLPNVTISDFASGLAAHGNLRNPTVTPFSPHEGRLLSPTDTNISLASAGNLKVNLRWLNIPKNPPDINGHPITGSCEHYVLYDALHKSNTKEPKDVLRQIILVPELAVGVNSQVVDQFFAQMEKNNYFLNMMTPSSQIFLIRNIVHHHNTQLNTRRLEKLKKSRATKNVIMNENGQVVTG
ncbi:uncharacterized protein LOC120516601 isoform X2 [Polypterus senegalus]|nr:uncharacterized protein LOC120516601 isoform X2 [Polypterus senegalus]